MDENRLSIALFWLYRDAGSGIAGTELGGVPAVPDGLLGGRTSNDPANLLQRRSTISFLISAIALAGFRFFGQVRVQFMIVWQR
jgi:hypothetical protein